MTLEILRTARRPLSTAECAQEFATRHGLCGDDPRVALIGKPPVSILDALQKAGRVRRCWTATAACGRSLPEAQAGANGLSKSSKSGSGGLFPCQ